MSFNPAFTVSQQLSSPTILGVADSSTGSDGAITNRHVYLQTNTGSYLVPSGTSGSFVAWIYSQPSVNIDVLSQDYALNILVQWLNVSGTVLYSTNANYVFTLNSELFYYQLTQNQALQTNIIQDQNYYDNKLILRVEIDNANNAITYGNDVQSAQASLDRAASLISNQLANF